MAANVFGNPVTDDTVRLFYPNLTEITANDRARVALKLKNAEEKAQNASTYVHNLKNDFGVGTCTLCMIYNATGDDLTFVLNHTWQGFLWKSPYPTLIQNGQWAAFLHVRSTLAGYSAEAVVYRGKNKYGTLCDWMLAWSIAPMGSKNCVYTEIREKDHYFTDRWGYIDWKMNDHPNFHSDTCYWCKSTISVGGSGSPELEAVMTLEDVLVGGEHGVVEGEDAVTSEPN